MYSTMIYMADFVPLRDDVAELKGLSSDKKYILIGLFAFIFIVSILVGRTISKKPSGQNPQGGAQTSTGSNPPQVSQKPKTIVALSPSNATLTVGKDTKINVVLSNVPVTAIDIVLVFDPKIVSVTSVDNGAIFEKVIRKKIEEGKITFSAAVKPENAALIKEGIAMSVNIKPLAKATSSPITFDSTGTITALNGENTLGQTIGGNYMIK